MPNKYYKKRRIGAQEITGPLLILENPGHVGFDELLEIEQNGKKRIGRVLEVSEQKVVCQVFEGTAGLDKESVKIHFTGEAMRLPVSEDMIGRTFDGMGRPIDDGGEIIPEKELNVNGYPLNPDARAYPRDNIITGVSGIDALTTLIRGQKLPIFSGSGLPHNELAAQIVNQAKISRDEDFNIIFAAMGIKADDATFFRQKFEEGGALNRLITFLNLADS
ncbi:MAG: V-type ATP synthase subunit B, partial [Candidatus Marinimicrobia bacterium]|nr:V-type ATP synthase subunit B [Candidatus Neomarinimicrobiota bacterium]